MKRSPPGHRPLPGAVLLAVLVLICGTQASGQEPRTFTGRPLAEALRALQAQGLRIVFSSAIVSPDLIVRAQPRATDPRLQLDELLEAHGLKARDGPGGTIQIVRGRPAAAKIQPAPFGTIDGRVVDALTAIPIADVLVHVDRGGRSALTDADGRFLLTRVPPGSRSLVLARAGYSRATHAIEVPQGTTVDFIATLAPALSAHTEHVVVRRREPFSRDSGVASETSLDAGQLARVTRGAVDDATRVVHAFPGVTAVDDYRSEFAVRGSPFRQVEVVIDGVPTQWLLHTAPGRGSTGSFGMLTAQILEDVTLRSGAYPRRYGERLGPQLEFTVREGSRTGRQVRGIAGGSHGTVLAEGPIGRSQRGSWLVTARHSYLEWPTEDAESTRAVFGFSDAVAKLVYDFAPSQQIAVNLLAGRANVDGEDERAPLAIGDGRNLASMVSLAWRSTLGSSAVLRQRVYRVAHSFRNDYGTGVTQNSGARDEVAYRADFSRSYGRVTLETGGNVGRMAMHDVPGTNDAPGHSSASSAWLHGAYAHAAWAVTPRLTLSPGLRVARVTTQPEAAVARWLLGDWAFRSGWRLAVSAGTSAQFPELGYLRREVPAGLRPERGRHFDLAIEHQLRPSVRWRATLFARSEQDILREPERHPRLVGGTLVPPETVYANALEGTARGFELLVGRDRTTGLSGWATYSIGTTRYSDDERRETYAGDFDQRHAFSLVATYPAAARTRIGATFRASSNLPVPGYLIARGGGLRVGADRNQVRLPVYARLDIRCDREFQYLGRRLRVFAEVLNVLNRANAGLTDGVVDAATGAAEGFTDTLFRRRPFAGIEIDF